jgi:hypothetical protein
MQCNKIILTLFFFLLTAFTGRFPSANEIDLVFCMDMSGSTNGLIPDFKNKLWETVNGICRLKPNPRLRIALIGYSRPSFGRNNGYVKMLCDFTEDFDHLFYELNLLKPSIEKGDQFVGDALTTAGMMRWSESQDALKIIFLLGNGAVTAGNTGYRNACDDLVKKRIYVNTVYCIQQKMIAKELPGWKFIAGSTGGEFFTYKISSVTPSGRKNPHNQSLVNMNNQLNGTYLYYGSEGKGAISNMSEADRQSIEMSPSCFYNRLQYKISGSCQSGQSGWDLINYMKLSGPGLDNIDQTLLQDTLKSLDKKSLERYILSKKDERNFVSSQIKAALIATGIDTIQPDPGQLPGIIVNSVNKLAREKGFGQR